MYDIEEGEAKVKELCEAIGVNEPSKFGAKYIEHYVLNRGSLNYQVFPGSYSDYIIIEEITPTARDGFSASLSGGPVKRLRKNGFIVKEVSVYLDGYTPVALDDHNTPENFIAIDVMYVGEDHPIIEYWEYESE